ncbi:MAG: glycosyltransferase [Bauldia sp.]
MTGRNAIAVMSDYRLFPAAVFLCDRLSSLNYRQDTDVFLFSESKHDVAIALNFGVRFQPRGFDPAGLSGLAGHGYRSEATYYRFFLPSLLGGGYRRSLYLDVDTYPQNSKVFALFDLDLAGHAVAAVRSLAHHGMTPEARAVLRKGGRKYFNAGVLLLDHARFAATNLQARLLEVAQRRPVPLRFQDQTVFNYVLDGDWLELSPSFNMMLSEFSTPIRQVFEPAIVHFAGPVKPWQWPASRTDHPVRSELERFLSSSPWKGFLASQTMPRVRPMSPEQRGRAYMMGALEHLRLGRFADVEQGLTVRRAEFLPLPGGAR